MCEKCGKEVSPFEMPEHLDFHYAQEMELREKEIFASDQAVKKRPAPLKDSSSEEEESEDEDDSEEAYDEEGSSDDQNYYEASEANESSKSIILLTYMPCPFTGPKMFCAGPNFLSQPKN